jgi:hypothetical protein
MMYYALRMMDYSWALSVESVQAASCLLQIVIPGYSNSTDFSNGLGLILIDSSMFLDVLWFVPTVCILDFLNPTQSSISIGRQFDMSNLIVACFVLVLSKYVELTRGNANPDVRKTFLSKDYWLVQ